MQNIFSFNLNANLLIRNNGDILNFSSSKQWYKVYSSGDGAAITGIQKIQ